MNAIENKANELVDKFGYLAPDVCQELLSKAYFKDELTNLRYKGYLFINPETECKEYFVKVKQHAEQLLKDRKILTAEEVYFQTVVCVDNGFDYVPTEESIIKAMQTYATQFKNNNEN